MGKQQKLKPDVILGNYWRDNARFADFFNAVIYDGKQVIHPDELEDLDSEESNVVEHRDYAESLKASRDNVKVRKQSSARGVEFVLLGLEHQEHIHYAMPMRIMGYDYGAYKKQYDSNARKYKQEKSLEKDEYLSRMRKTDKFMPVITVVIYYGEKPWDGAKTLYEMLNLPKDIEPYVNDYKMILIEAGNHNLKLHNTNNKDLFNLLGILLNQNSSTKEIKQNTIGYAKEHKVDKEVVMTAAGAVNSKIDYSALSDGKEGVNVIRVFEAERMEGRVEGDIRGTIRMLKRYKESETMIVDELMSEFRIPKEVAEEYLERFDRGEL